MRCDRCRATPTRSSADLLNFALVICVCCEKRLCPTCVWLGCCGRNPAEIAPLPPPAPPRYIPSSELYHSIRSDLQR